MKTENFKTEQEKQFEDQKRAIVLQHCVTCHQQLDLLQLRLINFDDLIKGVQDTIDKTRMELVNLNPPTPSFEPDGEPVKLKKV
jgi:mono/diheme cytochrome c family protein